MTINELLNIPKPNPVYYTDYRQPWQMGQMLWKSGAPERHMRMCDDLDVNATEWRAKYNEALSACEAKTGAIVVLIGPRGCGKTQLATSLVVRFIQNWKPCRYVKALDLFRQIRDSMGDGQSEDAAIIPLVKSQLLVIDELHERAGTEFESRTLANIIDRRYDGMKPTVFCSNQNRDAFAAAVGPSVVSRMHEVGKVIECNWPSFRTATRLAGEIAEVANA